MRILLSVPPLEDRASDLAETVVIPFRELPTRWVWYSGVPIQHQICQVVTTTPTPRLKASALLTSVGGDVWSTMTSLSCPMLERSMSHLPRITLLTILDSLIAARAHIQGTTEFTSMARMSR